MRPVLHSTHKAASNALGWTVRSTFKILSRLSSTATTWRSITSAHSDDFATINGGYHSVFFCISCYWRITTFSIVYLFGAQNTTESLLVLCFGAVFFGLAVAVFILSTPYCPVVYIGPTFFIQHTHAANGPCCAFFFAGVCIGALPRGSTGLYAAPSTAARVSRHPVLLLVVCHYRPRYSHNDNVLPCRDRTRAEYV